MEYRFRIKKIILPYIRDNSKTVEVRSSSSRTKNIKVGDSIIFEFFDQHFFRQVVAIRKYNSFAELVKAEDSNKIMPGWSKQEVLEGLIRLFQDRQANPPILAIEFKI